MFLSMWFSMKKSINLLISAVVIMLVSSCVTQRKMTYFYDVNEGANDSINMRYKAVSEPVIKIADRLLITVSALDPEAVAPFNIPAVSYMEPNSTLAVASNKLQYYTVDTEGNIDFPMLGSLRVAGLTKSALKTLLETKISASVNSPIVSVSFLNFSVTVMGEVARPGRYEVNSDRISVLDALAEAGDLTVYGKRDNVLLTRENDGKVEFVRLNLNSPELFTSPYFYLQQNDVLYVEPNNVRAVSSQNVSLYLSMVTTLASLATVIVSVVKAP